MHYRLMLQLDGCNERQVMIDTLFPPEASDFSYINHIHIHDFTVMFLLSFSLTLSVCLSVSVCLSLSCFSFSDFSRLNPTPQNPSPPPYPDLSSSHLVPRASRESMLYGSSSTERRRLTMAFLSSSFSA